LGETTHLVKQHTPSILHNLLKLTDYWTSLSLIKHERQYLFVFDSYQMIQAKNVLMNKQTLENNEKIKFFLQKIEFA